MLDSTLKKQQHASSCFRRGQQQEGKRRRTRPDGRQTRKNSESCSLSRFPAKKARNHPRQSPEACFHFTWAPHYMQNLETQHIPLSWHISATPLTPFRKIFITWRRHRARSRETPHRQRIVAGTFRFVLLCSVFVPSYEENPSLDIFLSHHCHSYLPHPTSS